MASSGGITVKLIGAKALAAELKKFPDAVQARAINMGVKAGARILTTHMRRVAYSGNGKAKTKRGFTKTLRKAIKFAAGKPKANRRTAGKAWVGLKKIKGETKARNYYRVLEFGRKAYKRIKTGHAYAAHKQPMRPFFKRAWADKRDAVGQAIVNGTKAAIAREAGRALAKSKAARR
jgi:hypothetical protein